MQIQRARNIIHAGFKWANWTDEQREAFLLAYKTLDKEVAQKSDDGKCPTCNTGVTKNYCCFCGQRVIL